MEKSKVKGKEVVIAVLKRADGTKRVIKETFWTKLRRRLRCQR